MPHPRYLKQPAEIRTLPFEYGFKLASGDSLVSASVAVEADLTVFGTPTISGTLVLAQLAAGTAGQVCQVSCQATTAIGDLLELDALIVVEDDARKVLTKQPDEIRTVTFSFREMLALGDTLSGTVTLIAASGLTIGPGTVTASSVTAQLSGGALGSTYQITCRVPTLGGDLLELDALVRIADEN